MIVALPNGTSTFATDRIGVLAGRQNNLCNDARGIIYDLLTPLAAGPALRSKSTAAEHTHPPFFKHMTDLRFSIRAPYL
jgi:hypothetical protein